MAFQRGLNAHLFTDPKTPAKDYDSPRGYTYSRTSSYDVNSLNPSRKRSRPDSAGQPFATPYSATAQGWSNISAASTIMPSDGAVSPEPFVNTRYSIKGGLDTPSLAQAQCFGGDGTQENDFRRDWYRTGSEEEDLHTPAALRGERNGKRRVSGSPANGWSNVVLSLVGNIAGKAWQFCTKTAFKGFYAGGGKGYDIDTSDDLHNNSIWESLHERYTPTQERESTPVPASYPEEYFPRISESRPAHPKRQRTDTGAGWVMVPQANDQVSNPASPYLAPRRSSAAGSSTRSKQPRPSLSKPLSRHSLIPVSRRSSGIIGPGCPAINSGRTVSYASQRSPGRASVKHALSPQLTPEAKSYAERIEREEREADASIKKFNARLKAMIREGKQALGTKVEVEDNLDCEMEDEGFADGYFDSQSRRW